MKKMTLFKKVPIAYLVSIPVFIAFVAVSIMCYINLTTYAVFYAEHTPHADNVDPIAIEMIVNLNHNKFPDGGIYNGDFDGKNTLRLMNPTNGNVKESLTSDIDEKGNYSFLFISDTERSYYLDSNLYPTWGIGPERMPKTKFTDEEKYKVQQEVKQFLEPMVEVQRQPDALNLQWLYDLLNYGRFN